jgi:hypothetical protein
MSTRSLTGRAAGPSHTAASGMATSRPARAGPAAAPVSHRRQRAPTAVVVAASSAAPPPPADPALARPGGRRVAVLKADKAASLDVQEGPRPLGELGKEREGEGDTNSGSDERKRVASDTQFEPLPVRPGHAPTRAIESMAGHTESVWVPWN